MLTSKQKQTYEAIKSYFRDHQIAPTETELAEMIGLKSKSRGVVHRYLTALCDEGLIRLVPNRRRNIELQYPYEDNELPIMGRIAAGQPIEAIVGNQSLNLSDSLLGQNRFVLRVKGDSMVGDNICDGDYIICEKRDVVQSNEIAVCLIGNEEATLKRVRNNHDGFVTLIPSNPDVSPMIYPANAVHIQGAYVGLIRLSS